MDSRNRLKAEIDGFQRQIDSLKSQGAFITNVRVERTAAGGTASRNAKAECRYARLRAGKGKFLDNGKKSKYIAVHEIDVYQAMCERGRFISRLERKIQKGQKKLKWLDGISR